MPNAAPAAAPAGRSVSSAGYWIGGGILVVGCGIAIVWFVITIVGLVDAPNDFDRIAIPGQEVVTLDDGDWVIYYEQDVRRSRSYGYPSVDVTGPDGRSISVEYASDSYSYNVNGNDGEALYEFHASSPGAYTIEATPIGEPGAPAVDRIAIGRPIFDGSQIGGILGSLALGAVAFLAGLVILIVTIVRRGRAKRRPAMAYGAAPYGGPPPYGGAPYGGPQPGGAPGYPPTPGSWPPPQAPGWGAPPTGQPPGDPSSWPPPAPQSSPWGTPTTPPAPSAEPTPPTPPSPWTPPGTPGAGSTEPDDDTSTS
jgi:hypothetical protein